jgi:polysaccharide export outer membrane protein
MPKYIEWWTRAAAQYGWRQVSEREGLMFDNKSGSRVNNNNPLAKMAIACVLLLAATTGLAGCASSNLPVTSVAQANSVVSQVYRVADGDKIRVTVFDEPNLTGDYQVGLDGSLQLPLIGRIAASGMTSTALSDAIAGALKGGGYVLTPRVAVELTEHQPIFILGEVKTPGQYPYVSNMTLEQAVAEAGGFTPRANKGTVVLRRQQWDAAKKVRLGQNSLRIAPGDTITVEEAFF